MRSVEDAERRDSNTPTAAIAPVTGLRIMLTDDELHLADQASRIVGAPSLADYCRDVIIAETTRILASERSSATPSSKVPSPTKPGAPSPGSLESASDVA